MTDVRNGSERRRLRWLTAILGLSLALPLFIVWILVIFFDTELSHQRAESENLTTARGVSRLINKTIDDTIHHLRGHEDEIVEALRAGNSEGPDHTLKEVLYSSPSISSIALSSDTGRGLVHILLPDSEIHESTYCASAPGIDWSKAAWFVDHVRAGGKPTLSNMFQVPCDPQVPNTAVVVPMKDDGKVVGIVRASFDSRAISRWFEALELNDGVQLTLVDGQGMVLYDSNMGNELTIRTARRAKKSLKTQPYFDVLAGSKSFIGIFKNQQTKHSEFVAFEPVKDVSWGVLFRQPVSVVDAPVRTQMFKFTGAMAAVFALGLTLVNSVRRSYKRENDLTYKLSDSVHDLTVISDISLEISRGLEVETLLDLLTESVAKLLKADAAMVLVWEDEDHPARALVHNLPQGCSQAVEANLGPTEHTLMRGRSVIIDDYKTSPLGLQSFIDAGVESSIMVPVMAAGKPTGVLGAMSLTGSARQYTDHDRRLLQAVAQQAGVALENSLLYSTQRNIADTLQTALLTVPEKIDGLAFSHLYRAATETTKVGGDFYDLFEIEPGRVAIIIGDVSGKGLGAATLTSLIKSTIRAYAYEQDAPSEVLGKANLAIAKHIGDPSVFVTVFLGLLDMSTGTLNYCRAGHPPPILKSRRSKVTLLEHGSPPLCVFEDFECGCGQEVLKENDTLVLYTDGIIEARGQTEMFGEDRLVEVVKNARERGANSLAKQIFDSVDKHTSGHFSDDAAVLTVSLKTKA